MKSLILVFTILFSVNSFAHVADHNFESLLKRHANMVNNDGEVWLHANLIQHEEHAELSEVMAKLMPNYEYGLEGMNLTTVVNDNVEKHVFDILFEGNWAPYFCSTFEPFEEWTDDIQKCKSHTRRLFGKALKRADTIKVLDAWGDYYGNWQEIVVILQNYETSESLYIQFDIVHEI